MSVSGIYDLVMKSPMGDQTSKLTVVVDGDTFTGSNIGPMGSAECLDGKIDGNTLTWTMKITSPMPMTLYGTVVIDGDDVTGSVKAGAFGTFPVKGTRSA